VVAVEARQLSFAYGSNQAVQDVSFQVATGEWFALLGPNGAGKSTTLHMLTTMLRPDRGSASIMGFDTVTQARQARAALGMIFQTPALDERLTAVENLRVHASLYGLPARRVRQASQEALDWAGLADLGKRMVQTMSGGMKRRLELARTLMHEPGVLFMDEPTVGLDTQGRRDLWLRINELRQRGLTVVMTTHYLPEAEACDRIGVIDQGQLVALGTPGELKQQALGTTEGSLEDVFFALTGRKIRPVDAAHDTEAVRAGRPEQD
jgi:ABC-2 type transport system ATP-binding protein